MDAMKEETLAQKEAVACREDAQALEKAGLVAAGSVRAEGYVFISYKSEEKVAADWLKSYIESHGYRCWMAPDSLHLRGTQDYGQDILQALRNCRCLLFAMSPKALGSWWVNQEVKTVMTKYHRPVIPFMVAPVPDALKEDSLYTFIENDKQILNAEAAGKEKERWQMDVLLPYLEAAFGERKETEGAEGEETRTEDRAGPPSATRAEWLRWRNLASFHLGRLKEFKETDLLDTGPTVLSPEARCRERRESATAAALALMRILGTKAASGQDFDAEGMEAESRRNLAELVCEYGDDFSEEVWTAAGPHAERGLPWAAFVMHARHYSPDGRTELKESDQAMVRRYLETAVKDPDNAFAAIRMGVCWQFGLGGEVSGTRALYWYLEGAAAGCPKAWFRLSQLYRWGGYGVRPDPEKAREMAERGVEAGDARCHALLGDILLYASGSTDGKAIDYGEAEREYAAAWRGGCHDVLVDVFGLKYDYKWELQQPEFQNLELLLERASRAGSGAAWSVFYARAQYWNWGRKHLTAENAADEEPIVSDAAIQYALAGTRQNNRYSEIMLGQAIILEALDEAGEIDTLPIEELVKGSAELRADPECYLYMDVMRRQTFQPTEKFFLYNFPLSRFWERMFDAGEAPSAMAVESEHSTHQFLQYLKEVRAEKDGQMDRVRRLWKGFRLLEQGTCAKDVGDKKWAEAFPEDSFRFEGEALEEAIRTLQDIPEAFPAGAEQLRGPVDKAVKDLRTEGDRRGSLLDGKVQDDFQNIRHLLDGFATQNTHDLRVARTLASLERRLSPPMLAAPLRLFRNAYLQKSASNDAVALGSLFFTLNARYREEGKNAGLLFAAREMLWKALHQMSASAVLPFLELCLFGKKCAGAELPQDFDAIEQAEPVIREIVETTAQGATTEGEKLQCIQIAYAMAAVFLDEKLRRTRGKAGWGATSLYNIQKGLEWLALVLDMQKTKGWEGIGLTLGNYAEQKAKSVAKKGYVVVQDALQNMFLRTRLEKCAARSETGQSEAEETIAKLSKRLDGLGLKDVRGFRHVMLEGGCEADFVVADDDVALVMTVLPEGTDYRALPSGEGETERIPQKSTRDCVDEGNVVSVALVDRLVAFRKTLFQMNPSARVGLRIFTSEATRKSMKETWGRCLEEDVTVWVSLEEYSKGMSVFGGKDGGGAATEENGMGEAWNAEGTIDELAALFVEAGCEESRFSRHVEIDGQEADFILSGDRTRFVYAVLPGGTDYRALPAWEEVGGGGVPRSTRDCVLDGNLLSEALLDHLVAFRNALAGKNPGLEVQLFIYANTPTRMSIQDIWADRLELEGIAVVSKAIIETWIERLKAENAKEGEATGEEPPEEDG